MSQTRSELVALNADIVGFSRLIADDLEMTTATMDASRDLVSRIVSDNDGKLVNFVGDNFMAVFADATDAMRAAISITTEIEAMNQGRDASRSFRFRMGLDQGVLTVSGGDYFGDALNVAARIQGIARPGGISVSGRVYRALDEPALRFDPIGRRHLKNIPEETEIYEFADLPIDGNASTDQRSLGLEAPTVAVLPIHTETVDESVRATADILRVDLIHRLTRIPQLRVVDAAAEPPPRGSGSTARYLIETGVLQSGADVRIYAKVVDVISMNVVKAYKWTSKAVDLFELSDVLVDEVARVLEVDLIIGEPAGIYAELDDPEAIEQVYLGWYHLTSGTPEGWARSLEHYANVTRSHPDKATGPVLTAYAYWMGVTNGWAQDPDEALRMARQTAQMGRELGIPLVWPTWSKPRY